MEVPSVLHTGDVSTVSYEPPVREMSGRG